MHKILATPMQRSTQIQCTDSTGLEPDCTLPKSRKDISWKWKLPGYGGAPTTTHTPPVHSDRLRLWGRGEAVWNFEPWNLASFTQKDAPLIFPNAEFWMCVVLMLKDVPHNHLSWPKPLKFLERVSINGSRVDTSLWDILRTSSRNQGPNEGDQWGRYNSLMIK